MRSVIVGKFLYHLGINEEENKMKVKQKVRIVNNIGTWDIKQIKECAYNVCAQYLNREMNITEDILLGFAGIIKTFGVKDFDIGVSLFIDLHKLFFSQAKLRWVDYVFGGNTPDIDNFMVLLDIKWIYKTGLDIVKINNYMCNVDEEYCILDESCLYIDDMVDLDKEAQVELANKLSLSKLRTEYLEAMDRWKSACKDLKLGGYKCEVDNHPAYTKWQGMLNRAYGASSSKWYDNVTVSESFKHYRIFKQWYLTQHVEEGWELDKDLLVKGNKVYCADRCCFLPKEINSALAINRSLIPALAEKYRKVLNDDIYKALLLFTVN